MVRSGIRIRHTASMVVSRLERQEWLDRPSYRLEHALTIVFASFGRGRERVSNFLHGTWLGHPLHPVMTALPTGAVATAVALDAASVLPGHSGPVAIAVPARAGCRSRRKHRRSGDRSDRLATHSAAVPAGRTCPRHIEHRRDRTLCDVVVGPPTWPSSARCGQRCGWLRNHLGQWISGCLAGLQVRRGSRSFRPAAGDRRLGSRSCR